MRDRHVSLQTLKDMVEIRGSHNLTLTYIDVADKEASTKKVTIEDVVVRKVKDVPHSRRSKRNLFICISGR